MFAEALRKFFDRFLLIWEPNILLCNWINRLARGSRKEECLLFEILLRLLIVCQSGADVFGSINGSLVLRLPTLINGGMTEEPEQRSIAIIRPINRYQKKQELRFCLGLPPNGFLVLPKCWSCEVKASTEISLMDGAGIGGKRLMTKVTISSCFYFFLRLHLLSVSFAVFFFSSLCNFAMCLSLKKVVRRKLLVVEAS